MLRSLRFLSVLFLVASALPSWAGFIRGQVRFDDGRFADHIVVRLRSDRIDFDTEMQTDIQGKFDFDGVPLNVYHLIIEGQGFRRFEEVIDISMSKMAYESITLHVDKDHGAPVPPEGPGGSLSADSIPGGGAQGVRRRAEGDQREERRRRRSQALPQGDPAVWQVFRSISGVGAALHGPRKI